MVKAVITVLFFICTHLLIAQRNLSYYTSRAENNSPVLADLNNQLLSNTIDSLLIRAALRPQVNGISNNYYAPKYRGWGYDDAITNIAQLQGLLQITKSFFTSATTIAQINGLGIQGQVLSNNLRLSARDLTRGIIAQYILTYGDQLQLKFNREILSLLREEDSILRILTRNNVYKQSDYLAFVVTEQQQELNTAQLDVQYKFDFAQLNYLAGIHDTVLVELEDPSLKETLLPHYEQSLFFRQFHIDSLRFENQRRQTALTYRPRVSVYADAGYNSSLQFQPYKHFGMSAGINLAIPIYDGQQKKLQYRKIDLAERTRLTNQSFFMRQYDQQLFQLKQQLAATDQLIAMIEKQVKYTETLIKVNGKLLQTGDIRLIDYINSLNNYFNAKNLFTQQYISRLQVVNQLNYWNR